MIKREFDQRTEPWRGRKKRTETAEKKRKQKWIQRTNPKRKKKKQNVRLVKSRFKSEISHYYFKQNIVKFKLIKISPPIKLRNEDKSQNFKNCSNLVVWKSNPKGKIVAFACLQCSEAINENSLLDYTFKHLIKINHRCMQVWQNVSWFFDWLLFYFYFHSLCFDLSS